MNPGTYSKPHHHRLSFRKFFVLSAVIVLVLWVGLTAAWNTRKMQLRMKCCANLKKIGIAISTYHAEYPERAATLDWLLDQGQIEKGELVCPSAMIAQSNYVLVFRPSGDGDPVGEVLAYEPISNHGQGANVLFRDGRCQFVPRDQLHELNLPEQVK